MANVQVAWRTKEQIEQERAAQQRRLSLEALAEAIEQAGSLAELRSRVRELREKSGHGE